MFAVKCLYAAVWFLFACVATSNAHIRTWNTAHPDTKTPSELMVDVINNLGLNILKMHNINNENNIALSPYGVASILTALLEGVRGRAALEIQQCGGFPSDKDIIRVGLRDIHRLLRSYFIPQEGFLSGLSLSSEKVTLKPDYQSILQFYGFDMTSFNTPIYPDISTTTSTSNITTTTEPPAPTTPDQTTTEATTETSTNTQTDETTTPTSTTPISTTPIDTTTVTEATTPALTTEETAETRIVTQTMLPDTTPFTETTPATTTAEITTVTTELTTLAVTTEATTVVLTTEPISTTEAGTTTETVETTTITESTTPFPEDVTTISPVKRSVQTDDGATTIDQTTTPVGDEFETTTFKLIKRSILDVDTDSVLINSLTSKYYETATYNPPNYSLDDQTLPIDSSTNHLIKMGDYTTNNASPISLTTSNTQIKSTSNTIPVITNDTLTPFEDQLGTELPNSAISSLIASTVATTKMADGTLTPLEKQFGTNPPNREISSFNAPTMAGATLALLIDNLGTKPPNRAFSTNLKDNITKMADNLDAKILNQIERSVNKNSNSTKMADVTKNTGATKNIAPFTGDTIDLIETSKTPTKIADTTKNEDNATKNNSTTTKIANSATNKTGDDINVVDVSTMLANDTKITTKMADTTKNENGATNTATNKVSDTKYMVDNFKIVANDTKNATKMADTTKNTGGAINDANSATNKFSGAKNIVDSVKSLKNTTKNMADATLADELGTSTQNRTKRSLIDYVIARYYDGHNSDSFLPEESDEKLSFLVSGIFKEKNIHFMTYEVVLPFFYISNLNALALKFPLDSPKYYLLLILPVDEQGIDSLICEIGKTATLKQIVSHMRPTYVRAIIPSFMLRGFVILTSSLQKIGIRAIFEPNHSDFSPMTGDQNIYVTNIEQAITVMIKNYMDPNMLTKNRNLYQYSPVDFKATHPFLYFVMDSEIDVALVAGKIVNPINSRIQ